MIGFSWPSDVTARGRHHNREDICIVMVCAAGHFENCGSHGPDVGDIEPDNSGLGV